MLTSAEKYIIAIIKSSVSDTECEDLIAEQDDYDEIIRIIKINGILSTVLGRIASMSRNDNMTVGKLKSALYDVFHNTLGTIIGYGYWMLLFRIVQCHGDLIRSETKKPFQFIKGTANKAYLRIRAIIHNWCK